MRKETKKMKSRWLSFRKNVPRKYSIKTQYCRNSQLLLTTESASDNYVERNFPSTIYSYQFCLKLFSIQQAECFSMLQSLTLSSICVIYSHFRCQSFSVDICLGHFQKAVTLSHLYYSKIVPQLQSNNRFCGTFTDFEM